nr:MAG TPA: hypothetical protein [Caudoviricetes sp.]
MSIQLKHDETLYIKEISLNLQDVSPPLQTRFYQPTFARKRR